MLGDGIIRWTARLAVTCYVGRLCVDVAGRRDAASQRIARWMWTIGCGIFLLHVAAAFHFLHGWSHAAAFEHVRQRTLHDIGWNSGSGIYVNYAFTLLWLVDTILWWRRLDWSGKRASYWIVQSVFAFLMIQATAVFGPPLWMPICAAVVISLIAIRIGDRKPAK
jgi:hypothetical protein